MTERACVARGLCNGDLRQGRARCGIVRHSSRHRALRSLRGNVQRAGLLTEQPGRDNRPLTALFRTAWEANPPPAVAPTHMPPRMRRGAHRDFRAEQSTKPTSF